MDQLITSLRRDDKCTPGKETCSITISIGFTLAITSQANAANYDTWGIMTTPTTDLVWPYDTDNDGIADAGGMDPMGSDGNYVTYNGFVYYNNANGDFDTVFKGDTVNGTISTYYLNHDYIAVLLTS